MVSYESTKLFMVKNFQVLILIVVDNGLVRMSNAIVARLKSGLNPYCSGQWSRTHDCKDIAFYEWSCLNPYCSGQWSRTFTKDDDGNVVFGS